MYYSEKGSILVLTLVFMASLVAFASIFAGSVIYNGNNAANQIDSAKALYIAEAGLNKAIYYLKNTAPDASSNGSWRTSDYETGTANVPPAACSGSDPCAESLNGGTYTIWVEDSGGRIMITSKGVFNGVTRKVRTYMDSSGELLIEGTWTEISN
jgi:Tfp pilus assembly protein PilX